MVFAFCILVKFWYRSGFARATPNVVFFDALHFVCTGGSCGPFVPGSSILAYEDANHLTREASFSLWPLLRCEVFAGL